MPLHKIFLVLTICLYRSVADFVAFFYSWSYGVLLWEMATLGKHTLRFIYFNYNCLLTFPRF